MTVKTLHLAAIPNNHNTIYRVFTPGDCSPLYSGKFTTMPPHIKQSLVVGFDYEDEDAFVVYVKLVRCTASTCVL